jgi:hypothetical protein
LVGNQGECAAVSNVVEFKRWNAAERLRAELVVAAQIIHGLAQTPASEEWLEAIQDLADDLIKGVASYRDEGRL